MNTINSHQHALKRQRLTSDNSPLYMTSLIQPPPHPTTKKLLGLSMPVDADVAASAIVPSVTVVLEGRSICHRIQLTRHTLHRMFVDVDGRDEVVEEEKGKSKLDGLDLSNAVPGYMVAYEDLEDDLLLAGDLKWKDFVRVVKRIRIIPAKASTRKHCRASKCD
ncbi:uncharacterized protein A4U43_C05F25020 [Asparagus officinalis]|uniref:Auxin-responsive protein n=1 Tax=Asparagus officinalis TaxID=4686 RepID=A0A5P1EWU4_ASPOF|nr:auxin-responsive protein IAA33 [Asparagus officinalis]ONK69627.1 uncharacterized protein A4U43_C05F25020 [Asparagus officinalis]